MSKKSRFGVYYNIEDSTYFYQDGDMTYYFVSETNRDRFIERFRDNRTKINKSLSNRFKFKFSADVVSDIRTYLEIEKYGFYVLKGGEKLCKENLEYDTQLLIGQD